jgi:hypothetical protein
VAGVLFGKLLNSPNGKTVEATAVARGIDATTIEAQDAAVGG